MRAGIEEWSENEGHTVKDRTVDKMKIKALILSLNLQNSCQEFSRLVIFEACNNVGNSMVVITQ